MSELVELGYGLSDVVESIKELRDRMAVKCQNKFIFPMTAWRSKRVVVSCLREAVIYIHELDMPLCQSCYELVALLLARPALFHNTQPESQSLAVERLRIFFDDRDQRDTE